MLGAHRGGAMSNRKRKKNAASSGEKAGRISGQVDMDSR